MPMRITFELSDQDLKYFRKTLAEANSRSKKWSADKLIANAAKTLEALPTDAPEFVLERTDKLRSMIEMVQDEEWRLEGPDRERVVRALSYFADPADLIPDAVPGIGFLDDAIMIELVVRELQHEIDAYADFCRLREQKDAILKKAGARGSATNREEWLEARRAQLQDRMRRRRRRRMAERRAPRAGSRRKSPLSLW